MTSPTGRTLNLLRAEGWTCQVVETWVPRLNIRRDLFGVADVLAVRPGEASVLLVQATSAGNVAHRIGKAKAEPRLRTWLACGQRFEVWGWGRRDGRWECRRVQLVLDDLRGVAAIAPARRKPRKPEPCLFNLRQTHQDARSDGGRPRVPSETSGRATGGGKARAGQADARGPPGPARVLPAGAHGAGPLGAGFAEVLRRES